MTAIIVWRELTWRFWLAAGDDALVLARIALDARLDETIEDLDDDAALFLGDGRSGPRRTGGEIFSNVKAGIVYPLGAELKHPWISPGLAGTGAGNGNLFHPSFA